MSQMSTNMSHFLIHDTSPGLKPE